MAKRKTKKEKKKLQFSQKMVVFSVIFSVSFIVLINVANFILAWNDKMMISDVVIQTITILGGILSGLSLGGYYVLSGARDISLNLRDSTMAKYTMATGMAMEVKDEVTL